MLRPSLLALVLALPAAARAQEARLVLPPGTDETLAAVLENASLTLSLEAEGLTSPQDYVAAARADYRLLLAALYSEGYYGGVISILVNGREAASIQPFEAPPLVTEVLLTVIPGSRFTFGRTVVAPVTSATELPSAFAPGEVARSEVVEEAAAAAIIGWRQAGYAQAEVVEEEVVAIHPLNRLDVGLGIAPGPRLTFGPVFVTGNEDVRTARILRIADIPTGDVFDPDDLERAATRLRRTGAFESVAVVEAEAIGPGNTLPIELQLVEALPRRVGFGAEISSLEGLSATAFWLHRNLFGGAERLRVEAEVSEIGSEEIGTGGGGIDYELGLAFSRPATFSADNDLTVEARLIQEDQEDYFLQQAAFDVGIIRYVNEDLTVSAELGLLRAREETEIETRDYTLLALGLGAELDRRDDPRDARSGFYLDVEATPFLSLAGDAGDGARLYADARYYRTLGERVTLAARGQVGSVFGADRAEVPQDFLFFSGGGGTVRGHPFQSLGVEVPDPDEPGETITLGGASFAAVQLEARVAINETFGAVAFADAGYVGEDAFPDTEGEYHAGVGLGVRYNSFIGPIRLDVATPATGDDAFNEVQVYVGIGQSF